MVEISKEQWLSLLKGRFMSNLRDFTDEELMKGIAEVDTKYEDGDQIRFKDTFLYLIISVTSAFKLQ